MFTINSNGTHRMRVLHLLAAIGVVATFAGCGGGGSSSTVVPPPPVGRFAVLGTVSSTTPGTAPTPVPSAVVNAYVWPDITTVASTTTADAKGNYNISLPVTDNGKTIVLTASFTVMGDALRYSRIATGLTGINLHNENINPGTTLATELVLSRAVGPPVVTSIAGSAVATIYSCYCDWTGMASCDVCPGKANVPVTMASGLVTSGPAAQFAASNANIVAALNAIAATTDPGIAGARQSIQMVRSLVTGVEANALSEQSSITAAINNESQAISNGVQGATAFSQRLQFVSDLFGFNSDAQDLEGLAPGVYTQTQDPVKGPILNYASPIADGKSWQVTSAVPGPTNGMIAIVTPANAIPAFKFNVAVGSYTVTIKDADTSVNYTATLTMGTTGSDGSTVTNMALNATFTDSALTQPLTLTGTMTGVPARWAGPSGPYKSATINGSIVSEFGSAQLTNLSIQWVRNSNIGGVASLTLDSFSLNTTISPTLSLSINNVLVDTYPPVRCRAPQVMKDIRFSGDLKAAGYEVQANNIAIGFQPNANKGGFYAVPSLIQGELNYTSPDLTFNGTANGAFLANGTGPFSMSGFPVGSLHLTGSMVPVATGVTYSADLTLVGSTNSSSGVGKLTINSLTLGSQSMTGAVTATVPYALGKFDTSRTTYSATLTQQPTGSVITLAGAGNNLTGTIMTGSTPPVKVASIGRANTLGLNELGDTVIIKYTDNTFETAASILP